MLIFTSDKWWMLQTINYSVCPNYDIDDMSIWWMHLDAYFTHCTLLLFSSPTQRRRDFLANSTTWHGLCDSFWTLCKLPSLSEILVSRRVSPAGSSKLSESLSAIVTFNYSFGACHHERASPGHSGSLQASSDWMIWPGQESRFHTLKWDAERIWQGWCNRTCSF